MAPSPCPTTFHSGGGTVPKEENYGAVTLYKNSPTYDRLLLGTFDVQDSVCCSHPRGLCRSWKGLHLT